MLALATLCYWPALHGDFVWDDENLVVKNPYIRSPILSGEMFRHWLQPGLNSPYYRPIQTVSMAVDYYLFGLKPLGYHFTNLALHAGAGTFLFLLLRRLLKGAIPKGSFMGPDGLALVIATLWLVHPIHNAAVAYVSGRADSLGFLFACSAWLLFLKAQEWRTSRPMGYLGAAFLMLVAVCSKEISSIWLALFAAHTVVSREVRWGEKLGRIAACLIILGAWLLMRQLPAEPALPAEAVQTSIPQRVVLVTRAVADYASLIIIPGELHMERILWREWLIAGTDWLNLPIHMGWFGWVGVLVIAGVVVACAARGPGQKLRIAGGAWFVLCFLPISNVIPLNAQAAEHWIYLASVGGLAFLAGVFWLLPLRLQKLGVVAVLLWGCGLAVRTNLRAAEWRSPVVFYSQTISAMGGTPRMFNNLGTALQRLGRVEEAERVYRAGLAQYPTAPSLHYNLGTLLARKGLRTEANEFFAQSHKIATKRNEAGDWAGVKSIAAQARACIQDGRPQDAIDILRSDLNSGDPSWELTRLECEALAKLERWDEALGKVKGRTEAVWWDKDARVLFAKMLERNGDTQQAIGEWRQAARLDVWDAEPWAALARIHREKGELFAAVHYQREAVERAPDHAESRFILGTLLAEAGSHDEASEELLKARYLHSGGKL